MSRIGRLPIKLPEGVKFSVDSNNLVTVSSSKGTLTYQVPSVISFEASETEVNVKRANEEKHTKQLHGTVRANVANMVKGVSEGYTKNLVMVGTGYKADLKGNILNMYVGYSHPIALNIPQGIKVEVSGQNNTSVSISGINKQVVGQFAALVRGTREPEPYLGKGVAYTDEHIRRKEGKKAGK